MNLFFIALKSLRYRWKTQLLSLILISLSIGILWVMREINLQSEQKLKDNLAGTDLVIGAKGSPMQIILSAIYHLDAPTGNIPLKQAERWMKHPMIREAVPLAYGDYAGGFKIVGCTPNYLDWYQVQIASGKIFDQTGEAVLGADAAQGLGLKIGDEFSGQHGDEHAEGGHGNYRVVGILEKSHSVMDQLILCSIESVWAVHEDAHSHEHGEGEEHHHHEEEEKEITAVLLRYKNKMAAMQVPRMINENSSMQAASPVIEINRLSYFLNTGSESLKWVAWALMALAAFSMMIQFSMTLKERQREFALLRSMGYRSIQLSQMLFFELSTLCLTAFILGEIGGRYLLKTFTKEMGLGEAYSFSVMHWNGFDWLLLGLPLVIGCLVLILFLRKIYKIDISDLLRAEG